MAAGRKLHCSTQLMLRRGVLARAQSFQRAAGRLRAPASCRAVVPPQEWPMKVTWRARMPSAPGKLPASRASSTAFTSSGRRRNSRGSGGGALPASIAACWLMSLPGCRGRNTGAPWLARNWAQPRKLAGESQRPCEITTGGRVTVVGCTTVTWRVSLLEGTGIVTIRVWTRSGPAAKAAGLAAGRAGKPCSSRSVSRCPRSNRRSSGTARSSRMVTFWAGISWSRLSRVALLPRALSRSRAEARGRGSRLPSWPGSTSISCFSSTSICCTIGLPW